MIKPAERPSILRGAHAKRAQAKYLIEGEYLDVETIATRLGVKRPAAYLRLKHARTQPGPVTWAKLGGRIAATA